MQISCYVRAIERAAYDDGISKLANQIMQMEDGSVNSSGDFAWVAQGTLPRSVKLGERRVAWIEVKVED